MNQTSKVRRRKVGLQLLAILGLVLLIVSGTVSWFVAGALVAPVHTIVGELPRDLSGESITLRSESGAKIAGWHVRAKNSRGVVVLLHGIRGSRLAMLRRARMLQSMEFSSVLIDLQAHGESSGDSITIGHLERHDARAAVAFAKREHPTERVGVIGVSLGGAAALLGSPLGVDAMVIESVYPTIVDAVHNRVSAKLGVLSSIPSAVLLLQLRMRLGVDASDLRPIDYVARVGCPLLVIGGSNDLHTSALETASMFGAAMQPKELWMVEKAGHVDLLNFQPDLYTDKVGSFFDRYLNRTARSEFGPP